MSSPSSRAASRRSTKKAKLEQFFRANFDDVEIPSSFLDEIMQRVSAEASASLVADPPPSPVSTPFAFARRNTWKTYQFQQLPRFLAYRGPVHARPPISLVLVNENFATFSLDLASTDIELAPEDYKMAEDVYIMFTQGFDDEVKQMNDGQLAECFESYLGANAIRQLRSVKMDGLMIMTNTFKPIFIVYEDKTDDDTNGYFEGLEVCRRCFLIHTSQSHGILVLRACPYVIIIAVVMDRKNNVLLAEPLAHIPFWGPEDQTVLQGARAMRALRNFVENYVPQTDIDVSRPFPIAKWQNVSPLNKSGLVFSGTFGGRCMVAKFTQRYSCEAHKAWHRKNLAPELYNMVHLGAGWQFVTMEYLSEDAGWHSVAKHPPDDKLRQLLTEVLNQGHETGFVHGDFRHPNLLINGNKAIQVIDFEWSGPEGKARYPVKLNPEFQWEPTAYRGAILKKIHDSWHVDLGASSSKTT